MYNPFHKTLPKFGLQMHRISVRFYEMGDSMSFFLSLGKKFWSERFIHVFSTGFDQNKFLF